MYLKILTSAWSLSPVGAFWVMLMGTFATLAAVNILGAIAGGLIGASSGDPDITAQAMNIGAGIGALSFSVEQEVEADNFDQDLLSQSGYNNAKARDILIRMARTGSGIRTQFLSSHPSGPERLHYFDIYNAENDR